MDNLLDDVEVRVLGCLIEKEMTTPEYYPLTLNALTNACNQKSNRDPIMALAEEEVVRALFAKPQDVETLAVVMPKMQLLKERLANYGVRVY